jgi:SecD/SecF fusion protein
MKRYYWKIVFCVVPAILAGIIVFYNYRLYQNGQGGFKLGVDLAGGTDLIYEVDRDKFPEGKPPDTYSAQQLAASLKQRIDPADLYNVTIRPVGEYRVEIILPTGGEHQAVAEEKQWQGLLRDVAEKWPPKEYKAAEGRKTELVARINEQHPEEKVADIEKFVGENYKPGADPKSGEAAWRKLVTEAATKWPPVGYDVGMGRLPVLINRVREQYPDESAKTISDFIEEKYQQNKEKGYLTNEQVQAVKELISRVGSLEFRILANTHDDKDAIEAMKKYFAEAKDNPKIRADLEARAVAGKPPPGPPLPPGQDGFETPLGKYTYTWVELGMKERQSLGLANAAGKSPQSSSFWKQVADAREKNETVEVFGSCLLYSRSVLNPRLPEKEANKKYEYFVLTRDPEKGKAITGKYLVNAWMTQGSNLQLEVAFQFNAEGGQLFHDLTSKNKPEGASESDFRRFLAVILDDKIESAPRLNAVISTEGRIEGRFTKTEVDRLVRILRAGALPASLKPFPVSESTMGATLGRDTIDKGTFSVGVAFLAILVFMLVYYRFAGLVACIALLANLLLTVAFMALVHATFTLPGLAGLVLMLGMAVDANVLIYERLREERDRGATLALAIRNGYDRAFPTIIDTHLSSIFTAIVLYAVGNDQLKGFGISLTVGLIISLYTSLYMTRLMFDIWQYKGWLHKLSMFRLLSRPNIDFMAIRYYWFAATIILTIFGASVFIYRLDKGGLNIDFIGGTAYGGRLVKPVDIETLRNDLKECNSPDSPSYLPDLSVEQIFVSSPDFSKGNETRLFTIRTSERPRDSTNPAEVQKKINKVLGDKLEKVDLKSYQIDPNNRRIVLEFTDPLTKLPAFASNAQVGMLLAEQFNKQGLTSEAQQFILEGLGKEKEGHFQWMELQLIQPVDRAKLETILKSTQTEFASSPQPERLEVFDSQLAADTQTRALYAILASWAAILLYLWFRFGNWTFGMAAVLCLIHDLFFTLGIIGFCHFIQEWSPGVARALLIQDFKIDLPTVAALLTLVGYSVSDTIVVFDRIREVRGKNPLLTPQMINDSVNQTLSRTLLTAFATWLVVFVLYVWGGEGVHLFGFVMVVGVIVGTYSSIYIASPLLLIFGEGAPTSGRQRQPQPQAEAVAP